MEKRHVVTVLIILLTLSITISSVSSQAFVKNPKPPLVILGNPYPEYLSLFPNETYTVYIYVADDVEIRETKLYYKVNDGEWMPIYAVRATINENEGMYEAIVSKFTTKEFKFTTFYGRATIPPQKPGSRVYFKAVAHDAEGHIVESQIGTYIVSNPEGKRVMVVDPSVKYRAFLENMRFIKDMINYTKEKYFYDMSEYLKTVEFLEAFENSSQSFLREHHWELLAKDYNVIIVSPEEVTNALKEFKPEVIILSNLWIKEWGLSKEELNSLIKYLRDSNCGLIVTHGTLYDGISWKDGINYLGSTLHIGGIEAYNDESIATLLGFELLPVLEEAKLKYAEKKPHLTEIPIFLPFLPSKGRLNIRNRGVISGIGLLSFEGEINTAFGWQYLLPAESLPFAKSKIRGLKKSLKVRVKEFSEFQEKVFGVSLYTRNMYTLDFPFVDAILNIQVKDTQIEIPVGTDVLILKPPQEVIERIRLLKVINRDLIDVSALSSDYMLAIVTRDEGHRKDGIRSVYISFEIEAGEKESFDVLRDLIAWASDFKQTQYSVQEPQIVLLANDIDWEIKGKELFEQFRSTGANIKRVKPSEFEIYKNSRIVVILGGPKAYDGIGDYVKQALDEEEQLKIIKGEEGIFVKRDVWSKRQVVIIIAGRDRKQTGAKVSLYQKGIDKKYTDLLAEFSLK